MYAQTNVQFFNQLKREGYSSAEFTRVLSTYEFAVHMFTGRFQPSGNVFISHVVRTASILSSLHAPAKVVAAGLIHSVYWNGDFGFGKRGISDAKRRQVKLAVGEDVEKYVARYTTLRWNIQTIPAICDCILRLDQIDKDVILMKLANELEHYLDFELFYYGDSETQRLMQHGHIMIEMAGKLGYPILAADLARVFREAISTEVPVEVCNLSDRDRLFKVLRVRGRQESALIVPKSYCKRPSVQFFQKLNKLSSSLKLGKICGYLMSSKKVKSII
jgi:(p)ppGpp synthase/HD superfamily hydrolase